MNRVDSITTGWKSYELLDSGEYRKLERFGSCIVDRPDPQAVWQKNKKELWQNAQAYFAWGEKVEKWAIAAGVPEKWQLDFDTITFNLAFGNFKHIGIFPEHAAQWKEIADICNKKQGATVLNLFGYTGGASLVAAAHGAIVTHVDASKQTIATVKENIAASNLKETSVRLIVEDALKYAKRLMARGEVFDIIVMDPPAFGRGPKGEVWKIEEKLSELIDIVPSLCSQDAQMVILNGYAAGYSARSFGELLRGTMKKGTVVYGDVGIAESTSDRILSTGIYTKWTK